MSESRVCSKCGEEFPHTNEYFRKHFRKCRKCLRVEKKEYYKNNKDKVSQYGKLYYQKNKEKLVDGHKLWIEKNQDIMMEYYKNYRETNRDKIRLGQKIYYQNNKEKVNQKHRDYYNQNKEAKANRQKEYHKRNPWLSRYYNHIRMSREKNVIHGFSQKDWIKCKDYFNGKCAYCGDNKEDLTQDHFIPLHAGGEYNINNIIPVCRRCNCSKNNKDFFKWYPQQPFYLKARERLILKYLNYDKHNIQQLALL